MDPLRKASLEEKRDQLQREYQRLLVELDLCRFNLSLIDNTLSPPVTPTEEKNETE